MKAQAQQQAAKGPYFFAFARVYRCLTRNPAPPLSNPVNRRHLNQKALITVQVDANHEHTEI